MDRDKKIAEFIRREVLWFFMGTQVMAFTGYTLGWGDWTGVNHGWVSLFLLVCLVLLGIFATRAKQRAERLDKKA